MSSDTAARARELSDEELLDKIMYMQQPMVEGLEWNTYHTEILRRLNRSAAPVEEVAREVAEKLDDLYGESWTELDAKESLSSVIASVLRQHGYGAQGQGNYHRAYQILGKALNLNQEFYGPAEMAQVAADRLTGKYDLPVEGQGVGPRCPKCGTPVEVCRVAERTIKFSCQVACDKRPHPHLFLVNSVADFGQFFSPVPSPESATKEP